LRVWVTRTQPGAADTARALREAGHEPVVVPVLAVRPITNAVLDLSGVDALAFTSRNGVGALAALTARRDLPVFTTGEATAAEARAIGFGQVVSADGDVTALSALIARRAPGLVLHAGAGEAAGDLVGDLAKAGVELRTVVVYETVETGVAPPEAIDAVLVHSPRAGRAVAHALEGCNTSHLRLYAISPAAARALAAPKFQPVAVAQYPNETALLKLLDG
jgi:uroporphyrinogen-III synthase